MLSAIIVCVIGAILTPFIKALIGDRYHFVLSTIPLALFLVVLEQSSWLSQTQGSSYALVQTYPWFPRWNIALDFRADGLSLLFAGLITGIGTIISLYAGNYLKHHPLKSRFYVYFFIFMASMLGIVFSDNFYAFFTFWELTGIASYFLIAFDFSNAEARKNALQALLVTGIGGLCLLAGFLMTQNALGSSTFSFLNQHAAEIQNHPMLPWILTMFFLAALTKSAQFPFHFWLPNAMSAPTPASAYLHSATMVKAGIFLLARIAPAFDSVPAWANVLVPVGALTVLVSAGLCLFQVDLKKLLAFSTLGALGIMTISLGIGTPLVIKSALIFLVAHALYKASLFLIVGIVDHATHTRDVRELKGLAKSLPFTTVALLLSVLGLLAIPPAISFIAKETLISGILNSKWGALWTIVVALGSMSFVFVGFHLIYIFFSNPKSPQDTQKIHEASWELWIGPLIMGFIGVSLPFLAHLFDHSFLNPAYDTFLKPNFDYHLTFWHGFSWPLLISFISVAGGYLIFSYIRSGINDLPQVPTIPFSPTKIYQSSIDALTRFSKPFFKIFQNGYLRIYLHVTLWVFVIASLSFALPRLNSLPAIDITQRPSTLNFLIQMTIALGAIFATLSKRVFTSMASLGMVGFGIALVYVMHGAPDLAMTQFLVETLTLILLVLTLRQIPVSKDFLSSKSKFFTILLAVGFGSCFVLITYLCAATKIVDSVSSFYASTSLTRAHGRNIVNVILVDYRGFDTMGEITVLAMAGLGVYTLLKPKKKSTLAGKSDS